MTESTSIKIRIQPQKLVEYFEETIGFDSAGSKNYGIWLEIPQDKFLSFLKSLPDPEYEKLAEARERYDTYTTSIMNLGGLYEVNIMTLAIIALIEFVMAEKDFERFDVFLMKRLAGRWPADQVTVEGLINEYYDEQGERRLINRFFNECLSEYEPQILGLLQQYDEWKECTTFKKFIDKILEYRNEFVHGLSKKTIWPFPARPVIDENLRINGLQETFSIKHLIQIVWVGIFRRFGFNLVRIGN